MAGFVFDREKTGRLIDAIRHADGIPMHELARELSCDAATIKRRVAQLREEYGAPIVSTREGYFWRPAPKERILSDALITVFCRGFAA